MGQEWRRSSSVVIKLFLPRGGEHAMGLDGDVDYMTCVQVHRWSFYSSLLTSFFLRFLLFDLLIFRSLIFIFFPLRTVPHSSYLQDPLKPAPLLLLTNKSLTLWILVPLNSHMLLHNCFLETEIAIISSYFCYPPSLTLEAKSFFASSSLFSGDIYGSFNPNPFLRCIHMSVSHGDSMQSSL